jgi:hypothetical protein
METGKKKLKDSKSGRGLEMEKAEESGSRKVFFCFCDKRFSNLLPFCSSSRITLTS